MAMTTIMATVGGDRWISDGLMGRKREERLLTSNPDTIVNSSGPVVDKDSAGGEFDGENDEPANSRRQEASDRSHRT